MIAQVASIQMAPYARGNTRTKELAVDRNKAVFLIILAIVVVGALLWKPDPNDPYGECRHFFGLIEPTGMCKAEVSARRLEAAYGS